MSLKRLTTVLAVLAILAAILACGGAATEAPAPAREVPAPMEEPAEEEPAEEEPMEEEPAEEEPMEEPAEEEPAPAEEEPLPPLPGFDDLLSFGTGGAEDGFCQDWGDSTACYFHDVPDWSGSPNPSEIWVASPRDGDWVTLPSPNSPVEMAGAGFPAGSPVYVLLFIETSSSSSSGASYRLVDGWVVRADSGGDLGISITVPWKNETKYLVVGATDPDGNLSLRFSDYRMIEADPWLVFWVRLSGGGASSCPGAPPQRMVVNQRGYICTKGDNVRLRVGPYAQANWSDSLPVGTQFTVIGGPICADDWSWWKVRVDNGNTGWISEGGDEVDPYFICPLP